MKLTDTQIRALKPREKLYRVADGHGLALEITPSGSKLWRYRYSWAGKDQMLSLGPYPLIGLRAARDRHQEFRRLLADGVDPGRSRPRPAELQQAQDANLFKNVASAWLDERRKEAKPKTLQKMETIVNDDLIPRLGNQPIATLPTPLAVEALKVIQKRAPHMAQKARTYLNHIVLFAVQEGLREDGKTLSLKGVIKLPKAKSLPAATDDVALGEVMLAISEYPDAIVRAGLRMTAYTALRPGNVVSVRWQMLDVAEELLQIPGEEMKVGDEHFVPLPRQAQEIINEARTWPPRRREYIFPPIAQCTIRHLNRDTLSRALRESGLRGKHVPHGFRASLRTRAREKFGVDIDVLEAQLAHSKGDATQHAYDRARFLEQRKQVMQDWADYLDELAVAERSKRDGSA